MNIKYKKISFVAEINLNSNSAYKHQVLKMCDAFSQKGFNVNLFIINTNNFTFSKVKKSHLLKKNFKITQIFKSFKKLNFFSRLLFAYKVFIKTKKDKNSIVYGRSIITCIFFSILKKNNVLEIHQPNSGITKFLFNLFKKAILKKTKFILINKNLIKEFGLKKNNFIVLDDGVDLADFKNNSKKKFKNTCVYTGSLHKGKGLEKILSIAKVLKDFKFYIYGDLSTLNHNTINVCKKISNIKLFNFVVYGKIPSILKSHEIVLMPYEKVVYGNHSIDISKYMSPLKLFDYLAAGKIILASKNQIYSHILKNRFNSILCNPSDLPMWINSIKNVKKNIKLAKKIRKNSLLTAQKYTWKKRIDKIINFV